jgi:hypothetical protein
MPQGTRLFRAGAKPPTHKSIAPMLLQIAPGSKKRLPIGVEPQDMGRLAVFRPDIFFLVHGLDFSSENAEIKGMQFIYLKSLGNSQKNRKCSLMFVMKSTIFLKSVFNNSNGLER